MQRVPRSHIAHFEGGPRGGTKAVVLELETGQPPDIRLTPGKPDHVYQLAGGPRPDSSLPYLHMPPTKAALIRAHGTRVTRSR